MKKVAIIGGGFSGLTMAWALCRSLKNNSSLDSSHLDVQIDLYERSSNLGGLLQTQVMDLGIVEPAANALLKSSVVEEMAKDFGITWAQKKKSARKRWVMTQEGQPSQWPLSAWNTLKNLDRLLGVAQGKAALKPLAQETLKQWGDRVFRSPQVVDHFLGPALSGVYSNRPHELSASLCLSTLFSKTPKDTSSKTRGSFAPQNGMREFFEKGLEYLKKTSGVNVHLNADWESTRPQGSLATDLDVIIDCRPGVHPELTINNNYLKSVSLFWRIEDRPDFEGFGCLFPRSETYLGVLFDSDIFTHRTNSESVFLEKWILKVHPNSTDRLWSDEESGWSNADLDELLKFRARQLRAHSQTQGQPLKVWVTPKPLALPKYDLHLEAQLCKASRVEFKGKFIYTHPQNSHYIYHGNYLGEIGLTKILHQSLRIAQYVGEVL